MLLRCNKSDLVNILDFKLAGSQYQYVIDTLRQNITMNGDVTFTKNIKIGNVMIRMEVYPLDNGDIEINIKNASIAGLGIFGVVRKKAGEMIVSTLTQYAPQLKTWKNDRGNIEIHIPGVTVKQCGIAGEEILLELLI